MMLLVGSVVSACVIASFLSDSWIGDSLSQFRLVWCCLLLPFLIGFACMRMFVPLVLVAMVFLLTLAPVLYMYYPIVKSEVRYFGKSHHPRISAQLGFPTYKLNLVLVHPPTPQVEARFIERNQELSLIASEIKGLTGPTVLVGDFNCGPWSKSFAELLKSGLKDSEQGFGPQPSWPARIGRVVEKVAIPPLVPIDHVLVSDDIRVVSRSSGPAIGADHLPVFVQMIRK